MAPSKSSQDVIDDFWNKFVMPASALSKASAVLPRNVYAQMVERQVPRGVTVAEGVDVSYQEARAHCETKVDQIIKECLQINQKYSDPYFDLNDGPSCLYSLDADLSPDDAGYNDYAGEGFAVMRDDVAAGQLNMFDRPQAAASSSDPEPLSVKRVGDIFDDPQFFVDGADAKDVRQGMEGDCWFLSALATLCNLDESQHLLTKVCVKWDQDVGVYGFVLYRDGEWISVVIDDKLYLRFSDYEDSDKQNRSTWEENRIRVNSAEEYRREFQSNSRALHFAQSTNPNETWVPLLEKAFAKAHGDYAAINDGSTGEGVEDLTGGISTDIRPANILSKDKFWLDLLQVNKEFLFGCATPNWDDPDQLGRDGIHGGHAYSILRAVEYKGNRLLMAKNPWGKSEWNGPWSDGSSQWTSESIKDLGHTFGDDGIFWIPYLDLLKKYDVIWRTRLFTSEWKVTQQWTSLTIPWAGEYQDTKFEVNIAQRARSVIVLSQLDDRYFTGLQGQYVFQLAFRVHESGKDDYIIRTWGERNDQRSVSVEIELEAGKYDVRVKVVGTRRNKIAKVEDVIRSNWLVRREKLLQTGLSYDLAHAKAQVMDTKGSPAVKHDSCKQAETLTIRSAENVKTESQAKPQEAVATTSESGLAENVTRGRGATGDYEGEEADATDTKKEDAAKDDDNEDMEEAPWGAVCVVGLRVYCREADASIQIVRPKEKVARQTNLDVDDPATDAAANDDLVPKEVKPSVNIQDDL